MAANVTALAFAPVGAKSVTFVVAVLDVNVTVSSAPRPVARAAESLSVAEKTTP